MDRMRVSRRVFLTTMGLTGLAAGGEWLSRGLGLNISQGGSTLAKGAMGAFEAVEAAVANPEGLMLPAADLGTTDFSTANYFVDEESKRVEVRLLDDVEKAAVFERDVEPMEVDTGEGLELHKPGYWRVGLPNMRVDVGVRNTGIDRRLTTANSWVDARWNRGYSLGAKDIEALLQARPKVESESMRHFHATVWNVLALSPTIFSIRGANFWLGAFSHQADMDEPFQLGFEVGVTPPGLPMRYTVDGQPYGITDAQGRFITTNTTIELPTLAAETIIPVLGGMVKRMAEANQKSGLTPPNLAFVSLHNYLGGGGGEVGISSGLVWQVGVAERQVIDRLAQLVQRGETIDNPIFTEAIMQISRQQPVLGQLRVSDQGWSVSAQDMLRWQSGDHVVDFLWQKGKMLRIR